MNLSYAGTHLSNGRSVNGSSCVTGLDQAGFIMGTSASLFNVSIIFIYSFKNLYYLALQQILDFGRNTISQFSKSDSSTLLYLLSRQLQDVRTRANDVANWPNPFQGIQSHAFQDTNATWLELIDGSSNQENIPYGPLLVKARNLDVIVTLEGSADDPINNWPKYVFGILT
jgi:lysophospholipase